MVNINHLCNYQNRITFNKKNVSVLMYYELTMCIAPKKNHVDVSFPLNNGNSLWAAENQMKTPGKKGIYHFFLLSLFAISRPALKQAVQPGQAAIAVSSILL